MPCSVIRIMTDAARASIFTLALLLAAAQGACSTASKGGRLLDRPSTDTAHISLGSDQVRLGDRIGLFVVNCWPMRGGVGSATPFPTCRSERIATGRVIRIINSGESVIRLDSSRMPASESPPLSDVSAAKL